MKLTYLISILSIVLLSLTLVSSLNFLPTDRFNFQEPEYSINYYNTTINGSGFNDTHVKGDGIYLYNDTTTMYLNETKLNNTIDLRATGLGDNSSWNESYANLKYLLLDSSNDPLTHSLEISEPSGNLVNLTMSIDTSFGIMQYIKSIDFFNFANVNGVSMPYLIVLGDIETGGDINATGDICITGGNCLSSAGVDTDTHVKGDGIYLYNDSTTMYLNETKLNQTINSFGFLTSIFNIFDQSLNTTDEVTHSRITITNNFSAGNLNRVGIIDTYSPSLYIARNTYLVLGSSLSLWDDGSYSRINTQNRPLILTYNNNPIIQYNSSRINFYRNSSFSGNINATGDICITGGNCLSSAGVDTDTHVKGDGIYLYNDSTTMYLNETKLNSTIDLRSAGTETDPLWTSNQSLVYLKSNPYGFYNLTSFDINNYYLKSNPYSFYNSTSLPSTPDADAIYRDGSQPPTADIDWDRNGIYDLDYLYFHSSDLFDIESNNVYFAHDGSNLGLEIIGNFLITPTSYVRVDGDLNVTAGNDICITGGNCLSSAGVDTDTHVKGDGIYLYNDSTTMYLNETKLNSTIDLRSAGTETDPLWTNNFTLYNSSWSYYETDTNETPRFNNLTGTNCASGKIMNGVKNTGEPNCILTPFPSETDPLAYNGSLRLTNNNTFNGDLDINGKVDIEMDIGEKGNGFSGGSGDKVHFQINSILGTNWSVINMTSGNSGNYPFGLLSGGLYMTAGKSGTYKDKLWFYFANHNITENTQFGFNSGTNTLLLRSGAGGHTFKIGMPTQMNDGWVLSFKDTSTANIYNNGTQLWINASGGVFFPQNITTTGVNFMSIVNNDTDALEQIKTGNELMNPNGTINHSAFEECKTKIPINKPVNITECFDDAILGEVCEEREVWEFDHYGEGYSLECDYAKTKQALALINRNINVEENLTIFQTTTIADHYVTNTTKDPETLTKIENFYANLSNMTYQQVKDIILTPEGKLSDKVLFNYEKSNYGSYNLEAIGHTSRAIEVLMLWKIANIENRQNQQLDCWDLPNQNQIVNCMRNIT